ncbi:FUSC family protein [Bradyrhizobium uaiense]|uniref:FUSC family protein n=1 Tax=Bradyrhizobium uaiense TaxID=2594946 RepID=A0A6P1BF81_9BRAD|nr:FUSC family protein [Bradyrhizobium uaiense]NEU97117.1 FUSC family protein [Bradyrhizobium uaiense]
MIATAAQQPFSMAKIPPDSLTFAVRVWLATILALFVSFWLQLEEPFTAAVTVAILAEPTRGQALDKAAFRLTGTVVGVTAAIVITGLFSQARDLMLAASAVWLGLCVFAAKLLDGYRAYAAVLTGYSVANIAIQQIDSPQSVFDASVERGAAIAVGIMSIAVVNALTSAPDRHSQLATQLAAIHRRVREYASAALNGERSDSAAFVVLVRDIVGLRPDLASVAFESSSGSVGSAAARSVAVGLIAELQAARALNAGSSDIATDASAWKMRELLRRDHAVCQDLSALSSNSLPSRLQRAPLYRSYRTAAETAVRATLWFALASTFLVWAGWSAASASLYLVAAVAALGVTTPNPRGFTTIALVGAPIAVVLAGILEFIVLDGTDAFSVLAIGLAPFTIVAALLTTSQSPVWSGIGRINLIAIPTILAPSNPQSYDPQAFLFTSLFIVAAAAVLLAAQILIPPVSDDRQRMQLLAEARGELHEPDQKTGETPEGATFRDATRIGQFLSAKGAQDDRALADMLSCFDRSAMIRLCSTNLTQLVDGPFAPLAQQAREAIVMRDTATLRAVARMLLEKASHKDSIEAETAAWLVLTSDTIDQDRGLDSSREAH